MWVVSRWLRVSLWLTVLAAPAGSEARAVGERPGRGVVIEEITATSVGETAGLRPGDMVVSWSRPEPSSNNRLSGRIDSPFDLAVVEIEQAPRGLVRLVGRRDGRRMTWDLPSIPWGLSTRPKLSGRLSSLYHEGRHLVRSGRAEQGVERWRTAAKKARRPEIRAWFLASIGKALGQLQQWDQADDAFETALATVDPIRKTSPAAQLLREWGKSFQGRSDWDQAERCYRKALELDQELAPSSLSIALDLNQLGNTEMDRDELAKASELFNRSLAIRRRLAPGSLDVARSLGNLGILAWRSGDLVIAEQRLRHSEEMMEKLAPGSLDLANLLTILGIVRREAGELESAEQSLRRSLEIRNQLAPGSLALSQSLQNLGVVLMDRDDWIGAEDFLEQALAIQERVAPDGVQMAATLNNLGAVAFKRGDLAAAEKYARRALAISEKLAPDGLDAADDLNNLGMIAGERGDLAMAEEYIQRALAIQERLAPGGVAVAASLDSLGHVAWKGNQLEKAEDYHRRALAIREQLAPGGLEVAYSLQRLGDISLKGGKPLTAAELYRRALAIREKLAPDSAGVAESRHGLGLAHREAGGQASARDLLCQATDALDQQRRKLGETEGAVEAFGRTYASYYRDCIDALIAVDRPHEAFHVQERSRARQFLTLLAERELRSSIDLDPEIARERRRIDHEYDRTQAALARLSSVQGEAEVERMLDRLRDLQAERNEIVAAIRKASPRFASLHYPEPLDFAEARKALDAGTVLLSYSVGDEETFLFVLQPAGAPGSGLLVLTLPIGVDALRERIQTFRNLLRRDEMSDLGVLKGQARSLYDSLIRPAERQIARSQRILIAPDGPLHTLPFAALVREGNYLAEWKPLHVVLSVTVYAELQKLRPEASEPARDWLVAMGDPKYPRLSAEEVSNPEVRATVRRGLDLSPLPSTRDEIQKIASLYPDRTKTFLGEEATEERAKAIGKSAQYVHFACHGLLDERFPLNSALALTIPGHLAEGQDNGLLQAWEVFESVRLDADLVTLSACDTALGQEVGGEGLVGLTRAFQYAGARTVLASLWSVSDVSTADLMKSFYSHLRAGKPKDAALQAAQVALIRSQEFSHPYHWAAFQLVGDWK